MPRLPIPHSDAGTWGDVLNEYLSESHNSDGTLKSSAVSSAGAEQTSDKGQPGGYAPLDGSGKVPSANLPTTTVPDATTTSKGIVQLAGDLDGTADAPTVPGLAAKADDSSVVHNTGAETIDGAKTFSSAPVVPDGSFSQSKVTNLTTDLASKEDSSNKGIAGGYAGLDGGGRVPVTQLGGTGADNTTFLRGDGTWSTGPVGPQGPQGDAGLDGKTVLSGSGAPSSGLGADGDFYIDTSASEIYGPKTSGAWGSAVSLVGPQGPQGDPGDPAVPTTDTALDPGSFYTAPSGTSQVFAAADHHGRVVTNSDSDISKVCWIVEGLAADAGEFKGFPLYARGRPYISKTYTGELTVWAPAGGCRISRMQS